MRWCGSRKKIKRIMAYSDIEKAEALIMLAVDRYNFQKTADRFNVPVQTLRRWNKNVPKKGVRELLERAIQRLLMVIPENMTGQDWSVSLGILMDKWLLVQGMPTQRTENIETQINELKEDEYERVIAEAEAIIREAQGSAAHS